MKEDTAFALDIKAMILDLPTQLESLIRDKVATGPYASETEVVAEALRLLEQRDRDNAARLEELRREVQRGIDQLDRGEAVTLDAAELDRMRDEAKARLATTSK